MIIQSALDIVDFDIPLSRKPIFAWLCSERAAGVWRTTGERIGDLAQAALAAMESWHGVSADRVSIEHLRRKHQEILDEIHPDCDFGPLHQSKLMAISSVASALEASIAGDDEHLAVDASSQAALAEFSIVKGAFYVAKNTYAGVNDHRSTIRHLNWQLDDLHALKSEPAAAIGPLFQRAVARGLLLAEDISHDRLI